MKLLTSLSVLMFMIASTAMAGNTQQTIDQVSSAETIPADVDYIITGSTPFAEGATINFNSTTHSVLIIKKIKPSKVISSMMKHIKINGNPATNGVNCQVRMFGRGTIVFPYNSSTKPLICYSEANFNGKVCDTYTEGSNNGFMRTLSLLELNNNIRSFRLKRGYMVTFAVGPDGWGYSRCFIADLEDLEINLPANMAGKVSSYRLFKWYNANKSGLADSNDRDALSALGASWCYRMWPDPWGIDYQPDVEYVPHQYKEHYPSASDLGKTEFSCHIKTNNEPGNPADEAQCDVATVLSDWPDLMRTGKRLLSESSHDGSMNHLKAFIDSIDARGWRCDILDIHSYWDTGSFRSLTWYSDEYGKGRPIWISEWIWGASWNNNGAFANGRRNDDATYNGTVEILNIINSNPRVERYAYWNSEAWFTKAWRDGALTKTGEHFAAMDEGLGYNPAMEFIPRVVYKNPTGLTATYVKSPLSTKLTCQDFNGDMIDSLVVECMRPGSSTYKQIGKVALKETTSLSANVYSFTDDKPQPGINTYRFVACAEGKYRRASNTASVTISAAVGSDILQYGNIETSSTEAITTRFSMAFEDIPAIFTGIATNKNTTTVPTSLITSVTKTSFNYQILPWKYSGTQTLSAVETIPYAAIRLGNYRFGSLDVEVGNVQVKQDTINVVFTQAFPEGVKPVVIADMKPSMKTNTINIRIWDVTNTGFKVIAMYEGGAGKKLSISQNMYYLACTPGQSNIDDDIMISAGFSSTKIYGTTNRSFLFRHTSPDGTISDNADTLRFESPYIFGALQTFNYPTPTVIRRNGDMNSVASDGKKLLYGIRIQRIVDSSSEKFSNTEATSDTFGWICFSKARPQDKKTPEDVNGDGNVDSQDVLAVYEYMQNTTTTAPSVKEDVNGDGNVDSQDVLAIYDYIIKS